MYKNARFKIILFSILLSVLTLLIMYFLDTQILPKVGKWTMDNFQKYLFITITPSDQNLIRFLPLLIGTFLITANVNTFKRAVRIQLVVLGTVILALAIGFILALLFWSGENLLSPLFPEYVKYQPFTHYWTAFIGVGIVVPLLMLTPSSGRK